MQKNILVLTENFPPKSGGSGRWFYELYTRLLDYQITVVTDINGNS
jgi:phosphatidylinositol alpha-1,6-mannosyltransferase